jgi:hypothetical protein
VSGYGLANTRVSVYRGTSENSFGDPEHRLDPDAVIATNVPATFSGAKKTVLVAQDNWDNTSQTPRNIEPLIVRVGAAADRRIPGGGIQPGDLLLDQRRQEKYAVKSRTQPRAVGRLSPDLVFELDRLS